MNMKRKSKPIIKKVFNTISSFALIGATGYMIFAGINFISGTVLAIALLSICSPVIIDGGSIIEVIGGIFEAFVEGLMGVIDAITSIFSF